MPCNVKDSGRASRVHNARRFSIASDRSRFEQAVAAVRPSLVLCALRDGAGDEDTAEDAASQTVIIALQKADWQTIENPRAWCLGVLGFVLPRLKEQRRRKTPLHNCPVFDESGVTIYDFIADDFSLEDNVVENVAREQERIRDRAAALDLARNANLTRRESACFHARMNNQGDEETAAALGIEPNAVRAYVTLACRKLRQVRQLQAAALPCAA